MTAYQGGAVRTAHLESTANPLLLARAASAPGTTTVIAGRGTDTLTCGVQYCVADGNGNATVTLGSGAAVLSHVSAVVLGTGPVTLTTPARIVVGPGSHGTVTAPAGTTFVTPRGATTSPPAGSVVGGTVTTAPVPAPGSTPTGTPTFSISGHVIDAESASVTGTPVWLFNGSSNALAMTTAAADGSWSFNGLAAGSGYVVDANDPQAHAYDLHRSTPFGSFLTLPADVGAQPALTLNPAAVISGHVSAAGTPVAGAEVDAYAPTTHSEYFGRTDAAGNYRIGGIVDFTSYTVSATQEGLEPTAFAHPSAIVSGTDDKTANVVLQHPSTSAPYRIYGQLLDANGNPLAASQTLLLYDATDTATYTTPAQDPIIATASPDQDGLYSFTVPAGEYNILGNATLRDPSIGMIWGGNISLQGSDSVVNLTPPPASGMPAIAWDWTQPVTATDGDDVTLSIIGVGHPTPTVTWKVSTDSGATFVPVSGGTQATSAVGNEVTGTLDLGPVSSAQDGYIYEAVLTVAGWGDTTFPIPLSVN